MNVGLTKLLLMEEILHHLGCIKTLKNSGINHLLTGAGFLPSTACLVYVEISNISEY